ncbi:hypothetical protein DL93DRAFT_2091728 [Clavulina sp. PMI_390]|nr:hypothetical protein DL93DRAFT_2091728 [Clavulina sp. PMI_390]
MHTLKVVSWRVAFFTGADNLIIRSAIEKYFGSEAAKNYELDCQAIKRQLEEMEKIEAKDDKVSDVLEQLLGLFKTSPRRQMTLLRLAATPGASELADKCVKTEETFAETVQYSKEAPLKSAVDFFDLSENEQCKILGIKKST